jgi:transposase
MKTASEEIRKLVVNAYLSGKATRKQLAEIFGYHIQSIGNWIREHRQEGKLAPKPKGHRKSVFTPEEMELLTEFIKNEPDATLDEIRTHFAKTCSLPAIHKIVAGLGFVFKKNFEGKRARSRRCTFEQTRMAEVSKSGEDKSTCVS